MDNISKLELYDEIDASTIKLVWTIAKKYANTNLDWLTDPEDYLQEARVLLWQTINKYEDKPPNEIKKIYKHSLWIKLAGLYSRAKLKKNQGIKISLDSPINSSDTDGGTSVLDAIYYFNPTDSFCLSSIKLQDESREFYIHDVQREFLNYLQLYCEDKLIIDFYKLIVWLPDEFIAYCKFHCSARKRDRTDIINRKNIIGYMHISYFKLYQVVKALRNFYEEFQKADHLPSVSAIKDSFKESTIDEIAVALK